jgi:hypothetical protein
MIYLIAKYIQTGLEAVLLHNASIYVRCKTQGEGEGRGTNTRYLHTWYHVSILTFSERNYFPHFSSNRETTLICGTNPMGSVGSKAESYILT